MEQLIKITIQVSQFYLFIGTLFAIFFILRGGKNLDTKYSNAPIVAKIIWIPATILLWVYLLPKIIRK
ncbi:hypothetical protein [Flammeovirga sp. SubArs3]|uniref:hypothetical protein n=1 Tax=Flammeovirga sp. SubArs3 TaxID=2995316 RepID=UPI00248BD7A9|nr:hypothetical protein [Flammeovirga sp. SubArs3]